MPGKNLPSYRLHKAPGQARVRLNGRDSYLGPHGTPESRAAYDRVIAEWLANGRALPTSAHRPANTEAWITVEELMAHYLQFARGYYRQGPWLARPESGPPRRLAPVCAPILAPSGLTRPLW